MNFLALKQKSRNYPKLQVELHGGIGNQLFQYYAGWILANHRGSALELDSTHLKHSWESHVRKSSGSFESPLQSLGLPGHYFVQNNSAFSIEKLRRFSRAKLGIATPLALPKIGRNTYISSVLGYDADLFSVKSNYIAGYFQTWKYFDMAITLKPELRPKLQESSSWFRSMESDARIIRPTVIHVRKHYSHLDKSFVNLSQEYYEKSIEYLDPNQQRRPIWIFAQSDLILDEYLPEWILSKSEVISPPDESLDFESMLLMSMGGALVTANSTFSYWAGMLSKDDCKIFAPKRLFVNQANPKDYYKNSWTLV